MSVLKGPRGASVWSRVPLPGSAGPHHLHQCSGQLRSPFPHDWVLTESEWAPSWTVVLRTPGPLTPFPDPLAICSAASFQLRLFASKHGLFPASLVILVKHFLNLSISPLLSMPFCILCQYAGFTKMIWGRTSQEAVKILLGDFRHMVDT